MTASLSAPNLSAAVREFTEEVLALAQTISVAEEIQWSASPIPKPREDTTERAKGGHSDPTLAIVIDDRRLAVREAVDEANKVLAESARAAAEARRKVASAVSAWYGEA